MLLAKNGIHPHNFSSLVFSSTTTNGERRRRRRKIAILFILSFPIWNASNTLFHYYSTLVHTRRTCFYLPMNFNWILEFFFLLAKLATRKVLFRFQFPKVNGKYNNPIGDFLVTVIVVVVQMMFFSNVYIYGIRSKTFLTSHPNFDHRLFCSKVFDQLEKRPE